MENKNLIIGLVVVGLLLIALFQGFQLYSAKQKTTQQVVTQVQAPAQGQANVPSNLQNLPQMVGGC